MSNSVKLICNCNFKKQSDIDETVFKIFKMFSSHLVKNSSPINKDSDIECVYRYDKLTVDHLRMFKKLADSNKSAIYLKEVVVDEGKGKKRKKTESGSDSEKEDKKEDSGSESEKEDKDGKKEDSGSESEKETKKTYSKKSKKEDSGSESDKESASDSDSDSNSDSDSGSDSDTSIDSVKDNPKDGMMSAMDSIQNHVTSLLTEIEELKEKIRTKE